MKILALWTDWGESPYRAQNNEYGGVGYYRIAKPFQALQHAYPEYQVDIVGSDFKTRFGTTPDEIFPKIFETYDVVVSKHIDNPLAVSNLLAMAQHYNKPVIFDLDDSYLNVKPGTPAYEYYGPGRPKRAIISAAFSLASGLVVSTQPLKDSYLSLNKNIDIIPNFNDVRDWNHYPRKFTDGKIRIGYMGSVTHNADFELVIPALQTVLKKYPNAELELLGLMKKETLREFKKRFRSVKGKISMHFGTPSWNGYPQLVGEMGWDIGIAPLVDDQFNRCKSHIKWMEYAMYKVPTVASKVYPYFEPIDGIKTIEHGKTGLLASTTEEWVQCLSTLIENESKRIELGTNAFNHIKEHWQYKDHAYRWKEVLDKYAIQ